MRREDMRFEIVGHQTLPLHHRPPQALREGHFGHMRTYPCVSLARRNAHVGFYDNERHSRQAERVRLHDLAPPGAKLRGIAHEKSRVATQLGGKGDQLRLGKPQAEKPVERQQYGGAVGRTAPEPGTERHPFVEAYLHAVHAVALPHQLECLDADVLPGGAIHRQPFGEEPHAGHGRARHPDHVVQSPHGEHHGRQLVVTVLTAAQDIQPQIYFAVCMQDHTAKI